VWVANKLPCSCVVNEEERRIRGPLRLLGISEIERINEVNQQRVLRSTRCSGSSYYFLYSSVFVDTREMKIDSRIIESSTSQISDLIIVVYNLASPTIHFLLNCG
jgi:hypothetical protein